MKKFLSVASITIGMFGIIMFISELWIIPHIPNTYNQKYNYVLEHQDEISILLMGNSYFENSLNPTSLNDSAFDFAISGRWIYWDKELLKHFVPQMQNLHTVIFPMGYRWAFEPSPHIKQSGKSASEFLYTQIYPYEKYMHIWYDRVPDKYLQWLAILNRTSEYSIFSAKRHAKDWNGHFPFIGQSPCWKTEQQVEPGIVNNPHITESIAEYTKYMQDMAKLCHEHNVRFIVVTPPCHDSFVENTRPEGIATLHQIIEDVRKEYPIEYKDYLQDSAYRADSLYFNCSHLNSIGATKFGAQIKADFNL